MSGSVSVIEVETWPVCIQMLYTETIHASLCFRCLFGPLLHPPLHHRHPPLLPGAGCGSEDPTREHRSLELRLSQSGWDRNVQSDGRSGTTHVSLSIPPSHRVTAALCDRSLGGLLTCLRTRGLFLLCLHGCCWRGYKYPPEIRDEKRTL